MFLLKQEPCPCLAKQIFLKFGSKEAEYTLTSGAALKFVLLFVFIESIR